MSDRVFARLGSVAAVAVAVLSIVYAVAYLGITPADQRKDDIDAFFRSYLAHPAGLRISSLCLFVSGLVAGVTIVALAKLLALSGHADGAGSGRAWVTVVGVVGSLATAAHGLGDMLGVDKLAHRYEYGDAATRAAVAVAHVAPSPVDPRGLATFLVAGLVALVFGLALRPAHVRLGTLGVVLGVDMVVLFLATAVGISGLVLLTGGLASVVLGPVWWIGLARVLWSSVDEFEATEPVAAPTRGLQEA